MTPALEKLLAAWPEPKIGEAQYLDWLIWALAEAGATGAVSLPSDLKQLVMAELEKFAREGEGYRPRYMPVTDEPSYAKYCQGGREACRALVGKLASGCLVLE